MDKRLVAAVAVVLIFLIAGGYSWSLSTVPPKTTVTTPTTAKPPAKERILVIGSTEYYRNPDIDIGYAGLDSLIERLRTDKVLVADFKKPGTYIPQAAESWEMKTNATGASYIEFKIRKGYKFTDESPVTASAVKWSYEREPKVDNQHAWWHQTAYSRLEVVDDYTLRMYLPDPPFIPHSFAALMLLQHGFLKSPTSGNVSGFGPAGTGPFRLIEYTPGERLVFEKVKDYPNIAGSPMHNAYADKVVVKLFADSTTMRLALEKGEIDIAWKDLTKPDLQAIAKNPNIVVDQSSSGYTRYLAMNWKIKPFDDVRVRRAVAHALNPKEIMELTQAGFAELAKSPVHPWMAYYIPYFDQLYDQSGSNVEKAKQLLAEAGYANGFTTEIWVTGRFDNIATESQIATIIAQQLAKAGIKVEIKQVEWGLYLDKVRATAVPGMAIGGWKFDYPDPDTDIIYMMTYENGKGRGFYEWGYKNLTADALIWEGRRLYNPNVLPEQNAQRKAVYEKIQMIHAQDVVNVPLFYSTEYEAYRKDVKGYYIAWTGYLKPVWSAYKEDWGITLIGKSIQQPRITPAIILVTSGATTPKPSFKTRAAAAAS